MAHTGLHAGETAADAIDGLRLELGKCQRELEACHLRLGQLERGEALLAGENRLLEMVAKSLPLPSILDGICRLVEEVSSGSLCSILLLDGDRLWHGAAPSLPSSYIGAFGGSAIGSDTGPCGRACFLKKPVIVSDIASEPLGDDYRDLALSHGLRACWSTPVFSSEGKVLGSFAVLSREPRSPTPQHQEIIAQVTHLTAVAIERRRVEERLRESEAYLREAQRLSLTGSFGLKVATGELVWSDETFCIMGYARTITPTLELVLHRVHPDDLNLVRETIERATREQADSDFEHRLLMPDGQVKHVHVMARATRTARGELEFVGAVMDITGRKKSEEALRASEHLARGQLEALASSLATLSRESVPEKYLEQVLRIAGEQLDAVGVNVWEMNAQSGCVELAANFQDHALHLPARNDSQPPQRMTGGSSEHPVWTEFFRTGKHCVYGRIENAPPWSEVALHPNGPWHDWRAGMVDSPVVPQLIKDIAASGSVATLNVPMLVADQVAGLFVLCFKQRRAYRPDEIELTRAMANQAMLAIKLMRLSQANRESAVLAERNRMARDLHDTLAQGFTGVITQIEATKGAMAHADAPSALAHIERAESLARASLGEARRSVRAMRSRSLVDGTLSTALDELLKRMTSDTELQAELAVQGEGRPLPPDWEEGLLRIAQESLTNTIKYGQARRFRATLNFMTNAVRLQLVDDGRGFDAQTKHEGFGLIGMRERAEQLAGSFVLRSNPGQGTEIVVELNQSNGTNGAHEDRQA